MTTTELYEKIGGDYADVIKRLPTDAMVARFVVMYLNDTSCDTLVAAWKAGDERAAFDAAHKAKGVCGNLSLTKLGALSSEICEALRPGNDALRASTDVDALVAELVEVHANTVKCIQEFSDAQ